MQKQSFFAKNAFFTVRIFTKMGRRQKFVGGSQLSCSKGTQTWFADVPKL